MSPFLRFYYINHRGDVAVRSVTGPSIRFGTAMPWYAEGQWILDGFDINKQAIRSFAVKNILGFVKEDM